MDLDDVAPRAERAIVIAGPVVSGVLGGVLAIASTGPEWAGVSHVLAVLAVVNLGVALFNLLPAFPLDGGRWLRAALVERGWEPPAAERVAVRTGSVLGSAVVAASIGLSLLGRPEALVALPIGVMLVALAGLTTRSGADPDPQPSPQHI
jgi:Zn-dependent protease